ncbi:MAG: glycosyltransferase family 4 protein [Thermoplasmatota archaeon]
MRILYLLGTFPRISSEACILNEVVEVKKKGHAITILAGDREIGKYSKDVLDNSLLEDTINFRNYSILRSRLFKDYPVNHSSLPAVILLGALKTADFLFKTLWDMLRDPVETSRTILSLLKTHNNIFWISDTYLSSRKITVRPDLVHVQFSHLNHLNQAEFISMKFGCPFTVMFRALDLYEERSDGYMRRKRKILQKTAGIVTISEKNQKVIKERFGKDSVVIHSAINIDKFKPTARSNGADGMANLIYVGRFVEKKGLKYLLKACQMLKKRGTDFGLTLIGNGPMIKSYLKKVRELGIGENVRLKEMITQEEVTKELMKADIFVLPSVVTRSGDRDILPNSLKEAMAMEIPVITSDISGIEELVEDGISGILVAPKDAGAIADAIQKLIDDPGMGRKMGQEGRKKVIEDFNIRIEVQKLVDFFESVVNDPSRTNE